MCAAWSQNGSGRIHCPAGGAVTLGRSERHRVPATWLQGLSAPSNDRRCRPQSVTRCYPVRSESTNDPVSAGQHLVLKAHIAIVAALAVVRAWASKRESHDHEACDLGFLDVPAEGRLRALLFDRFAESSRHTPRGDKTGGIPAGALEDHRVARVKH